MVFPREHAAFFFVGKFAHKQSDSVQGVFSSADWVSRHFPLPLAVSLPLVGSLHFETAAYASWAAYREQDLGIAVLLRLYLG